MVSGNRQGLRAAGSSRTPSFILIGMAVVIAILGFNYWNVSSKHSIVTKDLNRMTDRYRQISSKSMSDLKVKETKIQECSSAHLQKDNALVDMNKKIQERDRELYLAAENASSLQKELSRVEDDLDDERKQLNDCQTSLGEKTDELVNREDDLKQQADQCEERISLKDEECTNQLKESRQSLNNEALKGCQMQLAQAVDATRIQLLQIVQAQFGNEALVILQRHGVSMEDITIGNVEQNPQVYSVAPQQDLQQPNNGQPRLQEQQLQGSDQQQKEQPQRYDPQREEQPQGGDQQQEQQPQGGDQQQQPEGGDQALQEGLGEPQEGEEQPPQEIGGNAAEEEEKPAEQLVEATDENRAVEDQQDVGRNQKEGEGDAAEEQNDVDANKDNDADDGDMQEGEGGVADEKTIVDVADDEDDEEEEEEEPAPGGDLAVDAADNEGTDDDEEEEEPAPGGDLAVDAADDEGIDDEDDDEEEKEAAPGGGLAGDDDADEDDAEEPKPPPTGDIAGEDDIRDFDATEPRDTVDQAEDHAGENSKNVDQRDDGLQFQEDENHAKEDDAEEMIDNVPPANPPPETNMQIDQPVDADEGDDEEEEEGQIVGPGDNMVPSNI